MHLQENDPPHIDQPAAAASGARVGPCLRNVAGWVAVMIATALSCFWAFWGILENFHEGWYYPSLGMNLALMFVQYLICTILFTTATVIAIRWPWLGGCLFVGAGLWARWRFRGANSGTLFLFLVLPLVSLGLLFLWGRPRPRRWALAVAAGLPLLTLVVCGAEPAWRVPQRFDDGNRDARVVEGNGVKLVWAPAGPGWPTDGVTWAEAERRCRHLTADGRELSDTPQGIWRLPTADEVVRSLCRHGRHAGGRWDTSEGWANFEVMPDKESPLWDVHSMIIYWWTATEVDSARALRVSYNGHVMPLPKRVGYGYLGFRAVKDPERLP
jgi:hypothetical protein